MKKKPIFMYELDTSEPTGGEWWNLISDFVSVGYMSGEDAMDGRFSWHQTIDEVKKQLREMKKQIREMEEDPNYE